MIITTIKDITCTDAYKCSAKYVKELEQQTSKKYYRRNTEKPDGSVSILHTQHAHLITVETYD